MLEVSLQADLYMTHEDYVFVVNVVVINPTWKMVAMNVINLPTSAVSKLSAIVKICKYKKLHDGRHFIPMAIEVHGVPQA
jgi:hypothetical protein